MICEWNAIREKEFYFGRQIYRLNNIKQDRELNSKKISVPIKKNNVMSKKIEDKDNRAQKELENSKIKIIEDKANKAQKELENSKIKIVDIINDEISEEEQWKINNKILQESYEEDDEDINKIGSNNLVNFTNPLEYEESHRKIML
jgi:hypothetical protein